MAPVSTMANPSRAASRREAVDLPAPAGPSIATMNGRGLTSTSPSEHLPQSREALLVLGPRADGHALRGREPVAAHRAHHDALAQERLEHVLSGPSGEIREDEVPLRRDHRRAQAGEAGGEERPLLPHERPAPLDVLEVGE